jgi:ABC-type Fe3+/spermidine/putrescine transport system ATPase subunit
LILASYQIKKDLEDEVYLVVLASPVTFIQSCKHCTVTKMIWKIVTDFCFFVFFCLCIINKYVGQFVSQTPWIQAATLRDNVLFGSDFDAQRYEEVIKACALDVDIQGMQGNDLAEIGEQGLNLSGGQRARLALARYLTLEKFLLFLSEVLH